MRIHYITGNGASPDTNLYSGKTAIIFHVVNNCAAWGSGFVVAINQVYGIEDGSPRDKYNGICKEICELMNVEQTPLGFNQYVHVSDDVVITNMFAQDGFPTKLRPVAFDSGAFANCCYHLKDYILSHYPDEDVVLFSPRVGCGRGGAVWSDVEDIIRNEMDDLDIDYYVVDPSSDITTL